MMSGNCAPRVLHTFLAATLLLASCAGESGPDARCTEMAAERLAGVVIDYSAAVTDREDLPAFCKVSGTIDPNIGFEARLPLVDWNGKYYQSGCGGYCGRVLPDKPGFSNTINEALKRGYATITMDGGHSAGIGDPSWAKGNPEAVEVYGHRVIPLTHAAGTAIASKFYGVEPIREYFGGCSNGGRMAAVAAQRYPQLFDGILGGAGVLNLSQSGSIYGSWVVQANSDEDGNRVLTKESFAAKIPLLEQEVLNQCDAADGVTDRLVSAPRQCMLDVGRLPACGDDVGASCFTDVEKRVLRAWYQGPRNSAGEQLQPGMPPGSERFVDFWFLDGPDSTAIGNQLGGGFAKYMAFEDGTPDDYTALDFDFDTDPGRLEKIRSIVDAADPDLREFQAAGGKYLMWHGWADPLVLPDQSLVYYESVAAEMGGFDAIRPFFRLFMMPGHGHCWEIPGSAPDRFDPISLLDEWVESDIAPEAVRAEALQPNEAVVPELILYPYPQSAGIAEIVFTGDN